MNTSRKISIQEKIAYALGDGAANIAWRGVATFLFIFYTDVFGIAPATVGLLMLVARSSDGISDVLMGIAGDRTNTRYGKFRPWILFTAIPLAVILSLLFTAPNLSNTGKIIYAYTTYILFTLIYTANNIPYGALMAVMTGDDKERTSIGSYRMVGAFAGGMLVQGALLFLVAHFGNINPRITVEELASEKYHVIVSSESDVENVNIKTKDGIAQFAWDTKQVKENTPSQSISFSIEANKEYSFIATGESNLSQDKIIVIDQKSGYSNSIYLMSGFLAIFMIITFLNTKERVQPPKEQRNNLWKDLKDLIHNKPWLVLLTIGLLFSIYNSIKQGIVVIYFTHYLHNQLLAASFMVALMFASIAGAMITAPLSKKIGKKNLFIQALIFSGITNAAIFFCGPNDTTAIFTLGIVSEFAAAIFPTLFFAMLGDAADYSEFKNGRRATGLIYSAGSFATKFGGGIAGAIIGFILAAFHYNGQDQVAIQNAIPGIKMLMSWVPAIIAILGALFMTIYPLNQNKMNEITTVLGQRRLVEQNKKVNI
ncbi:MFS transporter [Marinifilum flexuosum]|uniref:GPH family glycoside/pentoside/hexuronide:cation symporter n=1 Tax=Marinifilum flexuosum TaxID=1117708 RepID=A0A419WMT2_9BACT|nr:MFS transporter [Marinifilum flexuosum]RKD96793.1 GPH family glycoside/pentoside/hexuronide:cation symporter [Marinifilum flexuosum]